ncbi:MAG: YihY/virulence factor BrkB family protein [Anaerolineae bacterium]|nr:YihY/virulence factor BrkB family protein [Anaerolineae bacterium]
MNTTKFSRKSLLAFIEEFYRIWITERPGPLAGALAYYTIFSIVPITYIAVTIAGFFVDASAATEQIIALGEEILGPQAVETFQELVTVLAERTQQNSTVMSVVSFGVLLFTASIIFFQLQYVLNIIWRVPPPAQGGTQAFIRNRLVAFVMVLGVGPLLVVATIISFVVSSLSSLLGLEAIVVVLTFVTYLGLATLFLAIIYKYLPNAKIAWTDVWVGSFVTAVMITLALFLFALFFSSARIDSALHIAGTATAFLLGFFFFAQIFVIGAVFTRVYASVFGSKIIPMTDPTA